MLFDNAAVGGAQGAGGGHIFGLLQGQHLAAHNAGHAHPVKQREYDEDRHKVWPQGVQPFKGRRCGQRLQVVLQRKRDQNDQQYVRDRVNNVRNAHHDHIHPAAEEGRDRAVDRADDQNQEAGHQAHQQADAGAQHQADGVVAAQLVGAADVREHALARFHALQLLLRILHGGQVLRAADLVAVGVGVERGHDERKDHDNHDHNQAHHGDLVFAEPAHAVLPKAHALAHDHQLFLLVFGCGQKILRVKLELKAQRILLHIHCRILLTSA